MSQTDGNSSEGESTDRNPALTGTGCYKNYDHVASYRKSSNHVPPENDCDYAPPYSSPIASQNRALISDSVRDEDMDFEECEPLTHGGGAEEDGKQPGSEAGVEYGHRHGKAHLHMAASRAEVAEMRRLIALEQPPGTIRERTSENELATEYECCYCTSKDHREHIDAEGLMPLPTSDLQLEMRALREAYHHELQHRQQRRLRHQQSQTSQGSYTSPGRPSISSSENQRLISRSEDAKQQQPQQQETESPNYASGTALNLSPALIPQRNQVGGGGGEAFSFKDAQPGPLTEKTLNKSADLASLDSSDTYASCQTHPCLSQGDLTSADDLLDCNDSWMLYDFDATGARTGSIMDFLDCDTSKLYINPLQKSDSDAMKLQKKLSASSMGIRGNVSTGASPRTVSQVKKSASGGFGTGTMSTSNVVGSGGCVIGKYSNMQDLVTSLTSKGAGGIGSNQRTESCNLIEGLEGDSTGSFTNRNEESGSGGVPKHRKTRFQQQPLQPPAISSAKGDSVSRKPTATGGVGNALTAANLITASQLQESHFMSGGGAMSTSSGGSSSTITGSQVSVEPVVAATSASSFLTPSTSMKVKCRRASFMPAKSLASATKKINQHLFGATTNSGIGSGSPSNASTVLVLGLKRDAATKKSLSLSNDSLQGDGRGPATQWQPESPRLDVHRRSKSILKNKGERLPNKFGIADPENERLLMDSTSAPDNGVGCDCEYSPQRTLIHAKSAAALGATTTGQLRQPRPVRPVFVHQRSIPDATIVSPKKCIAKFQSPSSAETELATIRQHRQQKMFKETALQGGSFESESTVQNFGDREEDFSGMEENRSLLREKVLQRQLSKSGS